MAATEATIYESTTSGILLLKGDEKQFEPDETDGLMFFNDGRTILICQNTDTGDQTISMYRTAVVDGLTAGANEYVDLGADEIVVLGPFRKSVYDRSGADHDKVLIKCDPLVLITPISVSQM